MSCFTRVFSYIKHTKKVTTITLASLSLGSAMFASAADFRLSEQQPSRDSVKSVGPGKEGAKASVTEGDPSIYIVQFKDPAVAVYSGGINGLKATSPKATGARFLNVNTPESKNYAQYLAGNQASFEAQCEQAFGRDVAVTHTYKHALNAMAMELTAEEAKEMANMPDVKSVTRERQEVPLTDAGPKWIGAKDIWGGNNLLGIPGTMGEGAVVAILDTGINSDHPSFADIGGDDYDHTNPLGDRNYIPGSYCDKVNPLFCNDKLIGAWDMVKSPDEDPDAPQDSDGHGSHTASTTAGNVRKSATLFAPTTQLTRKISGVAPHANIIAYDVCIDSCPGAALLGALEQVLIDAAALPDGIHALNYSISGGNDPYNDDVELAFLNVTEAGVFVSTSAGNEGPGPSTTGHNSPWVINVAAMTHNRRIDNSLTGLTSDGASLADILGSGLTSGFGPAPIVYAGDFPTDNGSPNDTEPEQCLEPFPSGHFNGEIVVCDRGTIPRVDKGANVLAGGAGGFVLANAEANGEAVVADEHFLPGVHIGFSNGETLKSWIAAAVNPIAAIAGFSLNEDKANGDIMAGFSSRGPNLAIDILKPDVGGPGVSVFAAQADGFTLAPEYQFLSGTSMSSPHNAGSGALLSLLTGWSPYEIKSALMMTANRSKSRKEDGVTPVDAFDVGAGRINVKNALRSGLVLDETGFNFVKANPDADGDPKTLNIASMQDGTCVGECSWVRTVTNKSGIDGTWRIDTRQKTGGLKLTATPSEIVLGPGESADIHVSADTTLATPGWNFGELELRPDEAELTNLHMPVAVQTALSTSPNLTKTVDKDTAVEDDLLTYTISLANGQLGDNINLSDVVPEGLIAIASSVTETVTNGETSKPFGFVSATEATWSGRLARGGLELNSTTSAPSGFLPLADFGIAPQGCPSNCDDGGIILNVPTFVYNGQSYSDVIMSVNGTLQAGSDGELAATFANQNLPSGTPPNNIIAALWTDLNMGVDGDGAEWYVGVLGDGTTDFIIFEWNSIPLFGDPETTFSFQIWVEVGDSGNMWIVYGDMGDVSALDATVGVENDNGTVGDSVYFNGEGTAPVPGDALAVEQIVGGTATLTFQARADHCEGNSDVKVNRVELSSGDAQENAIAVTKCRRR